jgi:hypothetical protein
MKKKIPIRMDRDFLCNQSKLSVEDYSRWISFEMGAKSARPKHQDPRTSVGQ